MKKVTKKKGVKTMSIWDKAKNYVGLKQIDAAAMTLGNYNIFRGWTIPDDENPKDKGFIIKDNAGRISWLPKSTLEDAYMDSSKFDFSVAVYLLKQGFKVARKGWNGKKMFIFHVPANSYPASGNKNGTLKGMFPGNKVPYGEYIAMKTAQDNVVPWLASQTDICAEDWCIV